MKLLFFYTYNRGYLSSFFKELSVRLSAEGHEVTNFSLKAEKGYLEFSDVVVYIERKSGYFKNYLYTYSIIKKIRPDAVLSNFSYGNPALLFGKLLGVNNNLVWFHSLNEQMNPTFLNVFIKRHFLKLADTIIANSFITKQQLNLVYKIKDQKLNAIPFWTNILDDQGEDVLVSKFNTDSSILKIGCPGRLTAHKNQRLVIEALSYLNANGLENFTLYIAGQGESQEGLQTLVVSKYLKRNVKFVGHLSANEMLDFYNSMDVVVLPSLHEAFGLVFIEAIALGTPVIVSSRFGALSFIENDKNDLLSEITFNPESVDSLVDKLMPYFRGTPIKKEYFRQLYLENFDKEKIYSNLKKLLLK